MIRDILVCLEGSTASTAASRVSIEVARELSARLAGLALLDDVREPEVVRPGLRAHADAWLARFEKLCRRARVPFRTLPVTAGATGGVLAKMTTHELTIVGRRRRFQFGSVGEPPDVHDLILRRAERPLLLVPSGAPATLGQTVVVAFDGSAAATRAATSFARSGLADTRTVHVAVVDDDQQAGWELAGRATLMLRAAGVHATPHELASTPSNVDALVELASKLGAGAMVMGGFGRPRLGRQFRDSATRALVERSEIPLYIHA